jgi:hypothetical protein
MTLYQALMIWLDFNAIVGTLICALFGADGLLAFRDAIINRFRRGVRG